MKGINIRITLVAAVIVTGLLLVIPCIKLATNQINEPVGTVAFLSPIHDSHYDSYIHNSFNDPYADKQWALLQIPLPAVDTANSEVIVAVLDTGIDVNHEDLTNEVIESINFSGSNTYNDVHGHGTHIAGIIAANANNGIGIAGAASSVKLLNVKIAEDNGIVWGSSIAKGILWATDRGARVINMSLAVPSNHQLMEEAVRYAWRRGAVIVSAVGNNGSSSPTYPAAYEDVLAVAAITPSGRLWSNSNYGSFVNACAPGVVIFSTLPDNKYGYFSGSSMAAAYVSAVAANSINHIIDTNNNGRVNDEISDLVKTYFRNIPMDS